MIVLPVFVFKPVNTTTNVLSPPVINVTYVVVHLKTSYHLHRIEGN